MSITWQVSLKKNSMPGVPRLRRPGRVADDQLRRRVGQAGILLPLPGMWKDVYLSTLAGKEESSIIPTK